MKATRLEAVALDKFDYLPSVHDRHTVTGVCHRAQVVRYKKVCQSHLSLEGQHEIKQLRTYHRVKTCQWLVGYHQAGFDDERSGH